MLDAAWYQQKIEGQSARIRQLEAEVARLREALRVLVEDGNPWATESNEYDSWLVCYYCKEFASATGLSSDDEHAPDCPWLRAKALLP